MQVNSTNLKKILLTPKNGYNNIYIFLGGIAEASIKYIDFFKNNSTIIPKKTKKYFF